MSTNSGKKLVVYHFPRNFGDVLIRYILRAYGAAFDVNTANLINPKLINFVGIGSILNRVPNNYRGVVWSTGCMAHDKLTLNNANVVAVRGRLTRARIPEIPRFENVALGDGGILTRSAMRRAGDLRDNGTAQSSPRGLKLAIIPHYVDMDLVKKLKISTNPKVLLIDVFDPPALILRRLVQCEAIISSSLHGLVVADSLRIPNARFVVATSSKIIGGDFKYRDYYSAFGDESQYDALGSEKFELSDRLGLTDILEKTKLGIADEDYCRTEEKLEETICSIVNNTCKNKK